MRILMMLAIVSVGVCAQPKEAWEKPAVPESTEPASRPAKSFADKAADARARFIAWRAQERTKRIAAGKEQPRAAKREPKETPLTAKERARAKYGAWLDKLPDTWTYDGDAGLKMTRDGVLFLKMQDAWRRYKAAHSACEPAADAWEKAIGTGCTEECKRLSSAWYTLERPWSALGPEWRYYVAYRVTGSSYYKDKSDWHSDFSEGWRLADEALRARGW